MPGCSAGAGWTAARSAGCVAVAAVGRAPAAVAGSADAAGAATGDERSDATDADAYSDDGCCWPSCSCLLAGKMAGKRKN